MASLRAPALRLSPGLFPGRVRPDDDHSAATKGRVLETEAASAAVSTGSWPGPGQCLATIRSETQKSTPEDPPTLGQGLGSVWATSSWSLPGRSRSQMVTS
jgi:hypothetical protein